MTTDFQECSKNVNNFKNDFEITLKTLNTRNKSKIIDKEHFHEL
jgi:hypothetical protein